MDRSRIGAKLARSRQIGGSRVLLVAAIAAMFSLALFSLQSRPVRGSAANPYTVTTDQEMYSAGDPVIVTGAGYLAGASYDIVVIRPDGTIVNSTGQPGFDTIIADIAGNIVDPYTLTLDAPAGVYVVEVFV